MLVLVCTALDKKHTGLINIKTTGIGYTVTFISSKFELLEMYLSVESYKLIYFVGSEHIEDKLI